MFEKFFRSRARAFFLIRLQSNDDEGVRVAGSGFQVFNGRNEVFISQGLFSGPGEVTMKVIGLVHGASMKDAYEECVRKVRETFGVTIRHQALGPHAEKLIS